MVGQLVSRLKFTPDYKTYTYFVKPEGGGSWRVVSRSRKSGAQKKVDCFRHPEENNTKQKYLYYIRDGNVYRSKLSSRGRKSAGATKSHKSKKSEPAEVPAKGTECEGTLVGKHANQGPVVCKKARCTKTKCGGKSMKE